MFKDFIITVILYVGFILGLCIYFEYPKYDKTKFKYLVSTESFRYGTNEYEIKDNCITFDTKIICGDFMVQVNE
jgi:hypothetical protein